MGFVEKMGVEAGDGTEFMSRQISPLRNIQTFLMSLTNANKDGRVVVSCSDESKALKFVMMNPAIHFREIVDEARSVVLAGGTMQPVSDVIQQLFSHVPKDQISLFSCGHVIPKENLLGGTSSGIRCIMRLS